MNDLVGIIRREGEIKEALSGSTTFRERLRAPSAWRATGSSTPAGTWRWTCATCCWSAECVALAALERTESRGGHTREDHPGMDPQWRGVNLVCRLRPIDAAAASR